MSLKGIKLGRYCEKMAVRFLKRSGYKILERNYRSRFGEIDAIAKEGGCFVFVEIKSRSLPLFGPPYLRITKKKRQNLIKSALSYQKMHGLIDAECRIDIVSISLDKKIGRIELIKGAFGE